MFCIHYFDNTLTEMCLGALGEKRSVIKHSETMGKFVKNIGGNIFTLLTV